MDEHLLSFEHAVALGRVNACVGESVHGKSGHDSGGHSRGNHECKRELHGERSLLALGTGKAAVVLVGVENCEHLMLHFSFGAGRNLAGRK